MPPDELKRPTLHIPAQPFHRFLLDSAARYRDKAAVVFEGASTTFGELAERAVQVATALAARGVGVGDRVLLAAMNRVDCIVVPQAVSMVGAATVLANASWKQVELEHALTLTRPVAVIADGPVADTLLGLGEEGALPPLRICFDDPPPGWVRFDDLVGEGAAADPSGLPGLPDIAGDQLDLDVLLPFSSGTTGLPKAVRYTHRGIVGATVQRVTNYQFSSDDRLIYFMPLFTIFGVSAAVNVIASGGTMYLSKRLDPPSALQTMQDERITLGFASGPVATALIQQPLEKYDLSSIRYFLWGGSPVRVETVEEITRRCGVRWLIAYGMTETNIAANLVERPDTWRIDCPGIALSDNEVEVIDPETGERLPRGEQGEIIVRGPSMMAGYLPEEENATVFLGDGWMRTGDIGRIEPEGWVHVTDRAKEMIKVSGFSVAPAEIERVLMTHPAVADCGVYGIFDERRGEVPKAAIVRRRGETAVGVAEVAVTADELMSFVGERLATYKHVRAVAFVDEIPRNAGGKILRRILRERDDNVVA